MRRGENPNERLKRICRLCQRISLFIDYDQFIEEILLSALGVTLMEKASLITFDQESSQYEVKATYPPGESFTRFVESVVKETVSTNSVIIRETCKEEERRPKESDGILETAPNAIVSVPVKIGEVTEGVLYLESSEQTRRFDEDDILFLETLGNLLGITLEYSQIEHIRDSRMQSGRFDPGENVRYGIYGKSSALRKIFQMMVPLMSDNSTVLITGESGTGKELIARAIHYYGERKNRPFIAVNCGALPESLLESELFGYMKGAFTGAVRDKIGIFKAAQGGTLFLDEIDSLSPTMQVKLYRALQEKEIRPVGGIKSEKVDVRIICAANVDLNQMADKRLFRKELLYRINIITIKVPPLRDRKEDIPILAQHFLKKYSSEKKKYISGFEPEVMEAFLSYDWRDNNVRELENGVERLVVLTKRGQKITGRFISEKLKRASKRSEDVFESPFFPKTEKGFMKYHAMEKRYIEEVLKFTKGNKAEAAKILGIPRSTLRSKMKKLAIEA